MDPGDVRLPEFFFHHESGAAHGPAVLLHEEALKLVGASSHGQRQRYVLDLGTGTPQGAEWLPTGQQRTRDGRSEFHQQGRRKGISVILMCCRWYCN